MGCTFYRWGRGRQENIIYHSVCGVCVSVWLRSIAWYGMREKEHANAHLALLPPWVRGFIGRKAPPLFYCFCNCLLYSIAQLPLAPTKN